MSKKEKKLTVQHFDNAQLKGIQLIDGSVVSPPYILIRYDRKKTHLPSFSFFRWDFLPKLLTDKTGKINVDTLQEVIQKNDVRLIIELKKYYESKGNKFELSQLSGIKTRLLTTNAYSATLDVFKYQVIDYLKTHNKPRIAELLEIAQDITIYNVLEIMAELSITYLDTHIFNQKEVSKYIIIAAIYIEHIFRKELEIITDLDFQTDSPLVGKYLHYLENIPISDLLQGYHASFLHFKKEEAPLVLELIRRLTDTKSIESSHN
jgi:hypothetical protein